MPDRIMMLAQAGKHEFELLKRVAKIGGFSQWLTYFHRGGLSLERRRIPVSIIPVFGRYPIPGRAKFVAMGHSVERKL
ncbi:hypothetical protein [Endozoicomonas sp. GU-1]|uniref:hypothetical protein n=1 Tax=Endozoicomonas sp. GU-1 TaxID=3009078 RepID=UPI0022B4F411|nr:hypothetical protein [Endozoicomonas sp. GU-1]WBA82941.1 hypothetical protein O2T12_07415 [Endozoicomonas sp. GU-1]WBA85868.1 hypothetical protein O3276_22055 [Endozoicomonas sp. GU-1]